MAFQPDSTTVNYTFNLTVWVEDSDGNLDGSYSGNVTVALDDNPGDADLGGNHTVQAVGGVATFTDLTLDQLAQATRCRFPPRASVPTQPTPSTWLATRQS